MNFMDTLRGKMQQRAAYNRTLAELRTMDRATLNDLNLYEGDFKRIARESVYGG